MERRVIDTVSGRPLQRLPEIVTGGGHMNADAGFGPWPDGWLMVGTWLRRHGLGWPENEGTHA